MLRKIRDPAPPPLAAVGIDTTIASFANFSEGISAANHGKKAGSALPRATPLVPEELPQRYQGKAIGRVGAATAARGLRP